VQFAISTAGNDPRKLEKIKAGIDMGFEIASRAFGRAFPELSMKTNNAIIERLNAWVRVSINLDDELRTT
jgi:uncharacterized protein YfbU (UPF0304 family)